MEDSRRKRSWRGHVRSSEIPARYFFRDKKKSYLYFHHSKNLIEFKRCDSSSAPLLFLQAEDLPISDLKYENRSLSFTVDADRHSVIHFYAESDPIWKAREDNDFELIWNPEEHLLLWKGTFCKGERIEVKL